VQPASVSREASSETAEIHASPDNRLAEKPTNGLTTLASPAPISEIVADAGRAPPAELTRPYVAVSIGFKALTSEAGPWQDFSSPGTGLGQDLANQLPSPAPGIPLGSDGLPSLTASESVMDLGLFQSDVAAAGRVSGDAAIGRDTGTTSVYVANEESSIWTILTTYALVIVPRQRKYQATILVVDPDDATRDALSVVLVRAGYFVLPAANVRDAWGMFRTPNAQIDLVLIDPNLPDVSGIHLCARLREISPTLPVMVCASEVEPAEVAQLQQLGVRYYLRKPIAFEELLLTVKAILR
jgi:CheY-like chemotaxis protein